MPAPTAALLSFRLGGGDGVSVEAAKWAWALGQLGFSVTTVAGEGPVDHLVPGLAIGAPEPPTEGELASALEDADLVVVENLCSLPLNPAASAVVARVCSGRPTVLHHHDLPWQRPHLTHLGGPPDDPAWCHVTINELSRRELANRGIVASTCYNTFDCHPGSGRRSDTRRALGVAERDVLVLQPTRALPRKAVPRAIALAELLRATYWLLGPAEDGYGPELESALAGARCPVLTGVPTLDGSPPSMDDIYAACDVVALPSTWEGFGNPAVESAVHRRPLAIGRYPVAAELAAFGFEWFDAVGPDGAEALGQWLAAPEQSLLERNHRVALEHFSLDALPARIAQVLERLPGGGFG